MNLLAILNPHQEGGRDIMRKEGSGGGKKRRPYLSARYTFGRPFFYYFFSHLN